LANEGVTSLLVRGNRKETKFCDEPLQNEKRKQKTGESVSNHLQRKILIGIFFKSLLNKS
jgi:hypothetical protein